jgi:uncharacterized MAPEG superfamily protein
MRRASVAATGEQAMTEQGMTIDLYYLALSALLCLVLWVPYVLARFGIWGIVETVGYPENPPPLPGWAGRAERAHRNMVENLVPFTALVLVAHVGGGADHMTAMGAAIFFWSRVAHAIVYMLGIPWARTLTFMASWVGSLMVFFSIIGV